MREPQEGELSVVEARLLVVHLTLGGAGAQDPGETPHALGSVITGLTSGLSPTEVLRLSPRAR